MHVLNLLVIKQQSFYGLNLLCRHVSCIGCVLVYVILRYFCPTADLFFE